MPNESESPRDQETSGEIVKDPDAAFAVGGHVSWRIELRVPSMALRHGHGPSRHCHQSLLGQVSM